MSELSTVFICTREDEVVRVRCDHRPWRVEPVLAGLGAQCAATRAGRVLVGTRDRGLLVSSDGGESWDAVSLPECHVTSVAISAADGALYAGTEPSRLFAARDGGSWSELEALQEIPSRDRWSFPPRPWTHHLRWIAPDPHRRDRVLAGVELGGLMYTEDGGTTFSDHRPGAKLDVHSVVWHPNAADRVYEAAGDGAAWSWDGGLSWEPADAGRDLRYCWSVTVDPGDPDCWYVSAASGPGAAHSGERARGGLYRWDGASWRKLGLISDVMPYAVIATTDNVLAGMADGRLLHGRDRGERWEDTGIRTAPILAMAAG